MEKATETIEHEYLFVLDTSEQPLNDKIDARELPVTKVHIDEVEREDKRQWDNTRYRRMVELRNTLLAAVREKSPELFLSLDSDILIHPDSVRKLISDLKLHDGYDAVGGKAYMTPKGRSHPSYANLNKRDHLIRPDMWHTGPVDVIMAMKLMTPPAYNIDYVVHDKGEDIGWSKAAKAAGLRLAFDGEIVNRHVMSPTMLLQEDPR